MGFGLPVTEAELQAFNEWRQLPQNREYKCAKFGAPQKVCKEAGLPESTLKPWLKESPGLRFIQHGKGYDGWWTGNHQMLQTEDTSDLLHLLHPDCFIIQEYYQIGCHSIRKKDALDVGKMGSSFGGAQTTKRDTVVTLACLGPHPAVIILADGTRFDRKLKAGEVQRMAFTSSDPPPFYALEAPREDTDTGVTRKPKMAKAVAVGHVAALMAARQPGEAVAGGGAAEPEEVPAVEEVIMNPGYVDAQKGLFDVAFERGLLDPGLLASKKGHKEYTLDGPLIDGVRDKSRSLRALVGNCEDFLQEVTAMYELVVDIMGDGFEQTPKGHPEVAGEGVEYEWGKSKMDFRRTNNYDPNVQRFERRVRQSMCTVDIPKAQTWDKVADKIAVLPKRRVRKYRRKANEYKKAYRIIDNKVEGEKGAGAATYVDIEKLRKKCKAHRCTEHQDYAFLQKN